MTDARDARLKALAREVADTLATQVMMDEFDATGQHGGDKHAAACG